MHVLSRSWIITLQSWGFKDYSAIESVQNRSLRYFFGGFTVLLRSWPLVVMLVGSRQKNGDGVKCYDIWNHLINMDNSIICKKGIFVGL